MTRYVAFIFCASLIYFGESKSTALAQSEVLKYDGDYKGQMTLIEDNSPAGSAPCGGPFNRTLSINNGIIHFIYNKPANFAISGNVRIDGTINSSDNSSIGAATLTGKIQGDVFFGQVSGVRCRFSLQLIKG